MSTSLAMRSCDGKVGALVEIPGVGFTIVTSPNANTIYSPPLGIRKIRMKQECHFGIDNPMLHPQFFSPEVGFLLAILKLPTIATSSLFHVPSKTVFHQPESNDFMLQRSSASLCVSRIPCTISGYCTESNDR